MKFKQASWNQESLINRVKYTWGANYEVTLALGCGAARKSRDYDVKLDGGTAVTRTLATISHVVKQ